ncbi:MAG: right-handed parallel beta-helix repeat-containing protein [Phycisphaerales bacterium]|nr:MAG: right-handed parallel beta-helix repeat-containing protein [Phycisphaerales bacterium]
MRRAVYAMLWSGLLGPVSTALATDVSGDQWGVWTLGGSPYYLVGDVRVPPGEMLTIEPGVEVIAQGHYKISVEASTLIARGAPDLPILMTATDTNAGWRGLRLESAEDASDISFCVIEYAKGTGDYPEVRGGGIMAKNCSPTISHCTIRYCYSHNTNYNGCGAAICTESSSAEIFNNILHDNIADSGGAIATMEYGSPVIRGNHILDNTGYYAGGGMYLGARSSPLIEGNIIMRNYASGWGGGGINSWTSYIFYNTYPTIRNNLIAHNSAYDGGGIYCRYDRALLTNNTLAYNSANAGGGIYALNYPAQAPQVTNCVLWENIATAGPQIYLYPDTGSAISVTYSDVQGGWTGSGNIDTDPLFVDPDGEDDVLGTDDDNFRLDAGSPCIDAGSNYALPPEVVEDLDGNPRFVDDPDTVDTGIGDPPIVDMGPYEYQPRNPADVNGDGVVDIDDVFAVLAAWGPCDDPDDCPADVNGDGTVDIDDLFEVLANWS